MKLAIMQPYAFPYIGYFQLMNLVDEFIFYDDVNFIKKGFINKNNILINGEAKPFTIPLIKASQNKLINEVEIVNEVKWKKKFLTSIQLAYKKAIMFEFVYPIIEEIISSDYNSISDLAIDSNIRFANYLEMNTTFSKSSKIDLDERESGQNRILKICKIKKANHYINPIGGIELYNDKLFYENEIKLSFIKADQNINYNQLGKSEFIRHLSIIDVLMNNNKQDANKLLNCYQLKSKS
jgi:hypothetical protein